MQFELITDHPVAFESRDHTDPSGTMNDNSRWPAFNDKLYELEWNGKKIEPMWILDMGCSGGGFVKDCLDDGHIAVGLEGSDYSLKHQRAEWATIPDNLFTCDATKPFTLLFGDYKLEPNGEKKFYPITETPAKFDVITAWEVMEHIWEKDLPGFMDNCLRHLKPNGLLIFSINTHAQHHHVCLHSETWWLRFFATYDLMNRKDIIQYFGDDWVRGPKQNAIGSFHVILGRRA